MLQMSPHDLLHHYCDLNEIPYHSSRDVVVTYMIDHPTHLINYLTPYGRVFNLLHQFVRNEINLETMMMSGDIHHAHAIAIATDQKSDCLVYDSLIALTS